MTPTETGIVEKVADSIASELRPYFRGLSSRVSGDTVVALSTIAARAAIAAMPDSTQLLQTMAERDALKHDLERQMTIANIECNEAERLRQILQTMAGALEQIESGAKLGTELFKACIEERKDRLTWYAVNVLQHNLAACQGTAETALAQFRAQEQRS